MLRETLIFQSSSDNFCSSDSCMVLWFFHAFHTSRSPCSPTIPTIIFSLTTWPQSPPLFSKFLRRSRKFSYPCDFSCARHPHHSQEQQSPSSKIRIVRTLLCLVRDYSKILNNLLIVIIYMIRFYQLFFVPRFCQAADLQDCPETVVVIISNVPKHDEIHSTVNHHHKRANGDRLFIAGWLQGVQSITIYWPIRSPPVNDYRLGAKFLPRR